LGEISLPSKGVFILSNLQESNTLQMTVAEILDRWPEVIPIFLNHKMACVGCSLADFMTLEDALDIYHLNKESFIEEIEDAIQTQKPETDET
jgi:hybrid cluster-associated redox disulfide protein